MENFNKEYFDYINSDKWRFIRRQVAEKNNYMCQLCHKKIYKGFHIHHITYENFGHEELSDLMFLCPECHLMRIHKQYKKKPKKIKNNKKKKENEIKKRQKNCTTCKYSKMMLMKHIKTKDTKELYCNIHCCSIDNKENICKQYKKRSFKKRG